MTVLVETRTWIRVCRIEDLLAERGAAALLGTDQVAIFRLHDGEVYAISNRDPFSGAYVMSRGIVGSRGESPTVASPMHKQVFDLRTGQCLDQPEVVLPVYPVRRAGDVVEVGWQP